MPPSPVATPKLQYRAVVDGLRAIAVLAVIGFHAAPKIPGGFVGVDVFFVISGFLITGLIQNGLKEGT
jgi:peptidoglycan/LPS O-acetylase OafA/YrhL